VLLPLQYVAVGLSSNYRNVTVRYKINVYVRF